MSKKKQNIDVNLDEKKNSKGEVVQTLKIGSELIGEITTKESGMVADYRHKKTFPVKTVDEGIQMLISEYNLHH
ncbi:DUF2969 domain-containing protein [Nicoliella spurrieriana]|uniref:DUF2969 domain-containing protein n=1 Tax=Nicoliella spurrieriana TaxID=2925830 RepID=A0A976RS88_9LACO|nr:DUF2969 domain-containing protein [Nicoliella spurrieriana]UQS86829.1 DUF2969 domain-containing protein [Nicoliella spurrieriana]